MTTKELVSLNPRKIRHNNELMQLYIQQFEAAFSYKPNCAGCTFNKDFNKLKKHVNSGSKSTIINLKPETMSVYKIKPKFRAQILTYIKDKRPHRTYGRNITDAFAKEFLKHGTKEQIAERKKMFTISEQSKPTKPAPDKDEEKAIGTAPKGKVGVVKEPDISEKDAEKTSENTTEPKEPQAEPAIEEVVFTEVTDRMSRKELDRIATEKGLNPNNYENKKLLAEAINNA